jgi:hypothetical protein
VTREQAQAAAEKSIITVSRGLEEANALDYASAHRQLRQFMANVEGDLSRNALDTGGVMLLGAACVTLLREAILEWPEKIGRDRAQEQPSPLPGEPS